MKHRTIVRLSRSVAAAGAVSFLLCTGQTWGSDQDRRQERMWMHQEIKAVCSEILEAFCSEERGPGQLRCLLDYQDQASTECQTLLDAIEQRMRAEHEQRELALSAACGDSLEELCADTVGPDQIHCLIDSYEEITADCQSFLDQLPARGPGPRDRMPME